MSLDKSHPIPLYFQLAEILRGQIQSGVINPGDRLPSERELSEQFGISRMTVRQALAYLIQDGVLVVRPGVGTFVAEPKLLYNTYHLLGFTEEMIRQGENASSKILEQSLVIPPAYVARGLGLGAKQMVIKIVRLRMTNDLPVLLETNYLPPELCPGLESKDLENKSLFALLEQDYGLQLEHTQQSLESTVANDYEANLFGIEAGAAMILLEGMNFLANERPVEYFKAIYRGDRFRFVIESNRQGMAEETSGAQKVRVVME